MQGTGTPNRLSAGFSVVGCKVIRRVFLGGAYPALICLVVLLGHILSAELAAVAAIACLGSAGLFATDSILPAVCPVLTLMFTLSRSHTPGLPAFSDYLFSSGRGIALALFALAFIISVFRVLMLQIRRGASIAPAVCLPLLALSAAFVLNGVFSQQWSIYSFAFGVCEAVIYLVLAAFFTVGLSGKSIDDLLGYFAYLGALCVLLLSAEILWLYLSPDTPISNGEAVKSMIVFGWGIWTSAGAAIAVLIPACFVGVVRSKHPLFYLAVATLALLSIYMTYSRGALLFGAFAYVAALIAAARASAVKHTCRALLLILAGLAVGCAVISWENIPELISAFFADNGRFRLWRLGISEFLSSPLFGVGFFGLQYPADGGYFTGAEFLPPMMHSTPVQLLASMGMFGAVFYTVYRISTLRPIISDPSCERLLVFFSGATMLLLSLLENYVFQFWPVIHYSFAMAVSNLPRNSKIANK